MKTNTRNYGWIPDMPDFRDLLFLIAEPGTLPPSVDLRPKFTQPYDQGQLGSCTANAIAGAFEFALAVEKMKDMMPSRLFIYYNERKMEGTIAQDAGAAIRDGIKSINKLGVCPEKLWPYNVLKFTSKPPVTAYLAALKDKATNYARLNNTDITALKACLAQGFPFVFGFSVYTAFESDAVAKTGVLNVPAKGEKLLGGHAVVCVGYDDTTSRFIVRNSWGTSWGQGGYFTIPYEYMTNANLADDFWTIRIVTEG